MTPRAALADVRSSHLVPFIGAGVSCSLLDVDGSPAFPTWSEFLTLGSGRLDFRATRSCEQAISEGRYVDAADIIKSNLSVSAWYRLLRHSFGLSYDKLLPESLGLPRAIWKCSRGLVVTTNYDSSLSWALEDDRHRSLREFGLEAPIDLSTILQANSIHPVLWHLHGRIDSPGSIVIAPDGYGQLYGDDPAVPKRYSQAIFALRHLIATRSLLFVGFSLTDANVVTELQHIHQLFDESDHSHFVISRTADIPEIETRIVDAGLRNMEILEVSDFGRPLTDLIVAIGATSRVAPSTPTVHEASRPHNVVGSRVYLRRRCRSVLVGSEEFRARVGPCIAEHRQQDHATALVDVLAEASSKVERRITQAVLHELNGAIEIMAEASDPTGFTGIAWANLSIFHAIGLEKLNRLDEAIELNTRVIENSRVTDELRLCAAFNREVCKEKLSSPDVSFVPWLLDRGRRLSTSELIWPKAFSMELIACTRQTLPFQYADLLDEAITSEISHATTGFGKTILNWAHYSGIPLDAATVGEVWRVASHSSVNVRVAMLGDLWAMTEDPTLSGAILDALDASAATSQQSKTVLRILSRLSDDR
jgi:hypothetical protein